MTADNTFIVYQVLYKNKVVYVGSGKTDRYLHTQSGCSHNPQLNKLFFTESQFMTTTVIREGLSKEESLELELSYIKATQPIYNVTGTNEHGNKITQGRKRAKAKRQTKITYG